VNNNIFKGRFAFSANLLGNQIFIFGVK